IVARKAGRNAGISAGGKARERVSAIYGGGCGSASQCHGRSLDGSAAAGCCYCTLQCAGGYGRATREAERANSRVEGQSAGLVVHVGVPEGTAIGVKGHGAVITPASTTGGPAVSGLRSSSFDERRFRLRDRIHRVAG